ncbi:Uncharacterised protein [Enterobacter hormaechei]|nr:Uncharacterised protein [Enterobacter hormaechei]
MAHPLFLSTPLCELLLNAKTFRQLGRHLIDSFALEARFDGLVCEDHIGHVAAGGVQREIHLLRGGAVWEQNIGILRR